MSDSVRPRRRQPTRLLRPWDSPGKNAGVSCHFLLQCMKVKSEREVLQSCLTLSDPRTAAYQALPSIGFLLASGLAPSVVTRFVDVQLMSQLHHVVVFGIKFVCVAQSRLTLPPCVLQPIRLLCPWNFSGKNTGAGCHFLHQGIFLTQISNPHLLSLLHCTTWKAMIECVLFD